jgi:hypothetical protein
VRREQSRMATDVIFEDVAPVIPVRSLASALTRYRQLGFSVESYGHGTGYGFVERGPVSLHLIEWDQHDPKRTGSQIYLYVSNADALHAEWTAAGVEGRFSEVGDTEYGLREFRYIDPDGTHHRVGSSLNKPQDAL